MFFLKEVAPIRQKNTFWSHDIQAYRRANGQGVSTTKSEIEAIERGIRASIMLNERMTKSFEPHPMGKAESKRNMYASTGALGDLRGNLRRTYGNNALESALYAGDIDSAVTSTRNLRRRRPTRNEGTLNQGLYSIDEDDDDGDDLANERGSLMRTANRIPGGLAEAGSVLFSPSLEEEEDPIANASYRTRRRPSFVRLRNALRTEKLSRDQYDVALHLSMSK